MSSGAASVRSSLSNLAMMVHKSTTRILAFKFTQVWGDADGDQTLRGLKLADDSDDEAQEAEGMMRRMSTWRKWWSDGEKVPDGDLQNPPSLAVDVILEEEQPEENMHEEDLPRLVASRSLPNLSDDDSQEKPMRRVSSEGCGVGGSRRCIFLESGTAGAPLPPPTSTDLAWLVLNLVLRFPVHWLKELRFYVLPLISALVPTITVGVVMHLQASHLIPVENAMSMEEISSSDELPQEVRLIGRIPQAIMDIALLTTGLSACFTLWAWKAVRRPILRVAMPAFLAVCALQAVVVAIDQGPSRAWSGIGRVVMQIAYFVAQAVLIAGTAFYVGCFTRNRLVMRVYGVILLVVICLYSLCRQLAFPILNGSDGAKAFFSAAVNPIIFEVLISGARMIARCVRKNHSSTSFLLVAPLISMKHTVGRFMTAMIQNPNWVLVVCLCNGVGELLLQATMPTRDAVLYRLLFQPFLKDGEAPEQQLQNSRNRALRMNTAMFETMSEIVATWSGAAMVFAIGISRDGESVPQASSLVESALMQTGIELFIDLVSMVLMLLINRYNTLKLAARRRWYWSIPVCPFVAFSSALLTWDLLFRVLCVVPDKDETIWTICQAQ